MAKLLLALPTHHVLPIVRRCATVSVSIAVFVGKALCWIGAMAVCLYAILPWLVVLYLLLGGAGLD